MMDGVRSLVALQKVCAMGQCQGRCHSPPRLMESRGPQNLGSGGEAETTGTFVPSDVRCSKLS